MVLFKFKTYRLSYLQIMSSNDGTLAIEVIRPKLSEACLTKRQERRQEEATRPKTIRPKLRYSVTVTPTGKMITIEGGDSDSDSNDEQLK